MAAEPSADTGIIVQILFIYIRLPAFRFKSDFFILDSNDVVDFLESISSGTSTGFFVIVILSANLISFFNASYGVICKTIDIDDTISLAELVLQWK